MKSFGKETLKIYWRKAIDRKRQFFAIVLCISISNVFGIISPLYYKRFLNIISTHFSGSIKAAVLVLGILTVLNLLKIIFQRVAFLIQSPFERKSVSELYEQAFAYLHRHSFAYFNNNFAGSFSRKIGGFVSAFSAILGEIVWSFIPLAVNLAGALIVFFSISSKLAAGMAVWTVIFLIINIYFGRYRIKFDLERSRARTEASGLFADSITNQANIKLLNGYQREKQNYSEAIKKVENAWGKTWQLGWIFQACQAVLAAALEVGVLYYAILLWRGGRFTVGDFVMVQSYLMMVVNNIWGFGNIIRNLYEQLSEASEMTEILLIPHEIQDAPGAKPLSAKSGKIDFDSVDFNYRETRKVFENFNLEIKSKEKTALVGPSGAGKTTVIKLILRMHDVAGGKILIDGQDISKVTQESLWQSVSYVPQDPILFHRSLMENIRYGKPEATDDEVIRAAKDANCHEFIMQTSDEYQSLVGERGIKLSGGERQRVAIARAILRDAPILILDEATSSLDSESEAMIQEALANLMKNKTVITIAHRLSTIKEMDRIIVIDNGKVIEEGSHASLLRKKSGIYKKLWQRQSGGFIK